MRLRVTPKLAYSWTGWPRDGAVPDNLTNEMLDPVLGLWEKDGFDLIDCRWTSRLCQMTFATQPLVRPVDITRKVKGRLVHALRDLGYRNCFTRKVSLRSLGNNSTETVIRYVADQLARSALADSRYIQQLDSLKYSSEKISLKHPQVVTHGRYWINLHLVLVVADRYSIRGDKLLKRIRESLIEWSEQTLNPSKTGTFCPAIKSFSIMPDHLHIVIRAPIDKSPQFLLETLWKALNQAAGFLLYSDEVYVGTFSEYSMGAIRKIRG